MTHPLVLLACLTTTACVVAPQSPSAAPPPDNSPAAMHAAPGPTFANPLNLEYRFSLEGPRHRSAADPVMLYHEGRYFLFASSSGGYWHSPDMRDWSFVVPTGLPTEPPAPALLVLDGRMYYTAHKLGAVYASDDPLAARWSEVAKLEEYADPMFFRDDDGRVYIYHGAALNGVIAVDEVDPGDEFRRVGRRDTLMRANHAEHGWERSGEHNLGAHLETGFRLAPYIEGPWMTKHDGTYYLQYSAPGTIWRSYADGVYTSRSPRGPFTYQPYSPFSYKPGGFVGSAGHAATFRDREGNYWRVATMVVSVLHKFERRLGIFPAGFDRDGVMRTDTWLGDYPQFLPEVMADPLARNRPGWMVVSARRPVRASSTLAGHPPELAVDEDIRTHWSAASGAPGEWLLIDLELPARIEALQVNLAEEGATTIGRTNAVAARYLVEHSMDGAGWGTLLDRRANDRDLPHEYVQLPQPAVARYVRITNGRASGAGKFSLRDLRLFGRGGGAAPADAPRLTVVRDTADDRSVALTWHRVPGAHSYVVRFGIAPDKLYAGHQVDDAATLTMHSLNAGVDYWFAIDAVGAGGVVRGRTVIRAAAAGSGNR